MDNSKLTISLLLVAFLLIIVTLVTLRKNKINVKFAIIWFIPAIAIALLALLPYLLMVPDIQLDSLAQTFLLFFY